MASISSSGEQSSRNSTSALKISAQRGPHPSFITTNEFVQAVTWPLGYPVSDFGHRENESKIQFASRKASKVAFEDSLSANVSEECSLSAKKHHSQTKILKQEKTVGRLLTDSQKS